MVIYYLELDGRCAMNFEITEQEAQVEPKLWSAAIKRHKKWVYENENDAEQVESRLKRKIVKVCSVNTINPLETRKVLIDKSKS